MIKQIIDKRNYIILCIIIILIIFILINNKKDVSVKTYNYFNENIVVQLYGVKNSKIFNEIDKIYQKYNRFYQNPDKNLTCKSLLEYGILAYEKTGGLIDITSYKLLSALEEDKEYNFTTTIDSLDLNDKDSLVNINIESIIGSFASKEVEKYLKKNNINQYIINEDGNIITGKRYNNEKYKISLMDGDNNLIKILSLENKALAVKGTSKTFKPYMVNPLTSKKEENDKIVAVISDDINEANSLANALYLMDKEEGMKYIKDKDVKAIWYIDDKIYEV